MKHRKHRIWRAYAACAVVVTLVPVSGATRMIAEEGPLPSGEVSSTLQAFRDWQVSCDADQPCRMSQTVVQSATARVILRARVFKGEDPTLLVSFPRGILLSPGWRYRIDGRTETVLPFEICDGTGCHAGVRLTPDLLSALKRGSRMQITFFDAARTAVEPVLSLAGFTRAWEALQ